MNCVDIIDMETPATSKTNEVRIPTGLLGFENIKDYVLLANPAEQPFAWLQVKDNAALAFIVVDPFIAVPDYKPNIPQLDLEFIGVTNPDDAMLLNIVTLHGASRATMNLKGPIVINRHTHVGKQIVIANAAEYSVQHPLPVAAA
ncbi:MAG TPA: flagellar assembly protein FliW [Verrucomicrobiae bacterium]|jgi:flagellar assembly factor FliW|nr:flagellar assembly protein FliW [Verrucomicrobiae bacterium]